MLIYHRTDRAGRDAIEREGFRHRPPPEGPSWTARDRDYFWFGASKEKCRETAWKCGWWVVMDVPDATPENRHDDGTRHEGVYRLHKDYINTLPRKLEEGD